MKKYLKKMIIILNVWRIFPIWLIVTTLPRKSRQNILSELHYWGECARKEQKSDFGLLSSLLLENKEYRNLLYHRIRYDNRGYIRSMFVKVFFPRVNTLYINTIDIGYPLYIQHGFATVIAAKKVGSYCWINQQVTIGYTFDNEPPTIGNGVRVSAGAKVLGDIEVGDNSIIAANAVVVHAVEENEIVGGVPAKKIGINDKHKLYKDVSK